MVTYEALTLAITVGGFVITLFVAIIQIVVTLLNQKK